MYVPPKLISPNILIDQKKFRHDSSPNDYILRAKYNNNEKNNYAKHLIKCLLYRQQLTFLIVFIFACNEEKQIESKIKTKTKRSSGDLGKECEDAGDEKRNWYKNYN